MKLDPDAIARIDIAIQREVPAFLEDFGIETGMVVHWILVTETVVPDRNEPLITRVSPEGTNGIVENGLLFEALHNWSDVDDG